MNRCSVCDCAGFESSLGGSCNCPVSWSDDLSAFVCDTCREEIFITLYEMKERDFVEDVDGEDGEMDNELGGFGFLEVAGILRPEGQIKERAPSTEDD